MDDQNLINNQEGLNGPVQLNSVKVIGDNWKCSDTNNGFLKIDGMPEEAAVNLLGTSGVPTVVQVAGSGARTMVLSRKTKPFREKLLLTIMLGLLLVTSVVLLMFFRSNNNCRVDSVGEFEAY